jgi:O-acetyl-ADP-ribose deacetylase (regulator of RNase III)
MPIAMDASAWLSQLDILEGDITKLAVDAIVNAANSSLLGGGGVDGAIHRAAGRQLTEECRSLNGCSTGEAKITKGYNLPARYVIHTVGPIWRGGNRGEDALLADCYRNCFAVAEQRDIKTLAFPAISTGVFAFPIDRASRIALGEIRQFLTTSRKLERVSVVCFEKRVYDSYRSMLKQIE